MGKEHQDTIANYSKRSKSQKAIDCLLKAGAFFIILEPIWMLLPFAGFLYGSVMHIEFLSRNPHTSWLVQFVFPTHTLFPLGLILILVGFSVFLVGAFQIYSAKLLKKGLVKNGIYSKFRNPQYVSLTLFGLGIILTWGRFITYIAFFIMMWLYYFLSKSEERKCLALFGKEYEEYRKSTYFLFPGESVLFSFFRKMPGIGLPEWANMVVSFVLVVAISIGSGYLVQAMKLQLRKHPPVIDGALELSEDGTQKVELVMVKGPVLQAAPFDSRHRQFWDNTYEMLISSAKIKRALNQIGMRKNHTLLVFFTPGSNWRSAAHHDYRTVKVNAFMVIAETPLHSIHDSIFKHSYSIKTLKLIRAQELSYGRLENGQDPAEGEVIVSGPPMGIVDASFQKRVQDRINFYLSGM